MRVASAVFELKHLSRRFSLGPMRGMPHGRISAVQAFQKGEQSFELLSDGRRPSSTNRASATQAQRLLANIRNDNQIGEQFPLWGGFVRRA